MEEVKEKEGDEYRKLFYETNAKYAVANYETAREKNMNTTMTQILKEVTEERDRVQEFMNILMDSLVRANKENSQLASKVNDLVKEKKVCRLQADTELRTQNSKAKSERLKLQTELDSVQGELANCKQSLSTSLTNASALEGKLNVKRGKYAKLKESLKTERSNRRKMEDELKKQITSLANTEKELIELQCVLKAEKKERVVLEKKLSTFDGDVERNLRNEIDGLKEKVATLESTNIKSSSDLEKEVAIRCIQEKSHAQQVQTLEIEIEDLKKQLLDTQKVDNCNAMDRELHLLGEIQRLMREVAQQKRERAEVEKLLPTQPALSTPAKPSLEDLTNCGNPENEARRQIDALRSSQEVRRCTVEAQPEVPEIQDILQPTEGNEWEAGVNRRLDHLIDTMSTADENETHHKLSQDQLPEFPRFEADRSTRKTAEKVHPIRLLDQPSAGFDKRTRSEIESRRNPDIAGMAYAAVPQKRPRSTSYHGRRKLGRSTLMPISERVEPPQRPKRKR